ncbi:Acetylxylan esterase precursor [Brevundimonas sp. SH203]|uniref:alpha/beta hydrolase n=1 Tax=Brevundimonas sp. SH203 TaxID=345167 RepID=UPI0009CD75FF|nr:alpha/beta hydrolase [Brevundimonas sp. SH203]GAW41122.1 Acetylxylan esterase precursor [Brevundimonas sp. SH203]
MKRTEPHGLNRRHLIGVGLTAVAAAGVSGPAVAAQSPAPAGSPIGPLPDSWRRAEELKLWPEGPPEGGFKPVPVPANAPPGFFRNVAEPFLKRFAPERSNGRSLLVMPGGAYSFVVGTHEGAATAEAFNRMGYTVYVLIYRLPGEGWTSPWTVPLQDAQRALRIVRSRASADGVGEDRIAALGYSAGGHLAASLATAHQLRSTPPRDAIDRIDARPSAVGLIYPVIAMTPPFTNPQSALSLIGAEPSAELIALRSPDRHVDARTPPTFLVHALDDTAVPPENSLSMLTALRQAAVPVETHLFQQGGHGFGLGRPDTPNSQWPVLFDLWLGRLFAPSH